MSRLSIKDAQRIANERGGQCLSTVYVNNKEKLRWRCAFEHEWMACLGKIKNSGQWCPDCGGTKKLTIDTAIQLALQHGGRCLSTKYINCFAPLEWQCIELHIWFARLHDVRNGGTWCPQCAHTAKLTIEDAHRVAVERGGECLSDTYVNSKTHLKWRCKYNHEWAASLNKIKNCGQWCPDCGGTSKLNIDIAHNIASERGGFCLSTEYINCESLLQWRCVYGHYWMANLTNVKNKHSWCPECAGHTKWTIEELNQIAATHGGKLNSIEYINSQSHLEWECEYGHLWLAIANSIVQGSWCPMCCASRGERTIAEWLKSNNIEFKPQFQILGPYYYDFYIPSTQWIIEFDGLQHFQYVPFFHDKVPLERRQEIDREKTMMAYINGHPLLRIHYYDMDKIPLLLELVVTPAAPHVRCSRTENYEYLGLNFSDQTEPSLAETQPPLVNQTQPLIIKHTHHPLTLVVKQTY